MNSISNNLNYIIFDILNQFNLLHFWPITPYPKLGLAIINFKQKLTILSSFPLISNHCSISKGKNQPIPHVIANNHKNARTEASTNPNCIVRVDWWPYWLESVYAKGPMEWKISLLWSWDDGRIDWSQSMQYFFDSNRILKFIWKIEKCARCCCIRRKIELKKNPRYMLLHWTNLLQLFITRSFTPSNFYCYCILGSNVTQLYFIIHLLSW